MPSIFKAVEYKIKGLKCDNCDYRDYSVEYRDYPHYLHYPCPKCGHILLTESQYAKCQTAIRVVRIYNVIVFPYHIFKYLTSKEYREVKVVTKVELQNDSI